MVRIIFVGFSLIVMIGLVGLGLQGSRSDQELMTQHEVVEDEGIKSLEKRQAPNFVLKGMNGEKRELISKGKPTMINFWTSWCGPCQAELPILQRVYEKYKDDVQFQMVNLTVDDQPDKVKKLVHEKGYTLPILFDVSGEVSEVYQVFSVPTTYFVDKDGYIYKKILGAMTEKQLTEILSSMNMK